MPAVEMAFDDTLWAMSGVMWNIPYFEVEWKTTTTPPKGFRVGNLRDAGTPESVPELFRQAGPHLLSVGRHIFCNVDLALTKLRTIDK